MFPLPYRTMSDIESNLGTMVINEEEDSTMKQYGTVPGHSSYRFLPYLLTWDTCVLTPDVPGRDAYGVSSSCRAALILHVHCPRCAVAAMSRLQAAAVSSDAVADPQCCRHIAVVGRVGVLEGCRRFALFQSRRYSVPLIWNSL